MPDNLFTEINPLTADITHRNNSLTSQNEPSVKFPAEADGNIEPVTPDNFNDFSYSKKSHFKVFHNNNYDKLLFGREITPEGYRIKKYQNLLIFSFITQNIPEGTKILEIGSGDNNILNHFKLRYECWRISDANNLINEPDEIETNGNGILTDNKGNIHNKLPAEHFDFIFSTSAFEDIPEDLSVFKKIDGNINRLLKPDGFSLHCFQGAIYKNQFVYNSLLNLLYSNSNLLYSPVENLNKIPDRKKTIIDPDLHTTFEEFIRADKLKIRSDLNVVSFNFLCKKKLKELPVRVMTQKKQYFKTQPGYIFHHLIKCGGTSVKEIIHKWFDIKYDYVEDAKDMNSFLEYKINVQNLSADSCIVGHFQFDGIHIYQRYPEILENKNEFRAFTFIRDPLLFRASLYYYTKKKVTIKDHSLTKIIMNTPNLISNLFPCNESNYKEVLDRYFFIGIVEKMQESFDKLAELANKKKIVLPFVNKSEKDSQISDLSPEFIEKFKTQNKLDYLIYNYCLEKFNKLILIFLILIL